MEEEIVVSRNQEQEKIFFAIYQALFMIKLNKEFDIVEIIEESFETSFEDVSTFAKQSVVKTLKNYDEIRKIIEPNLKNFIWDRVNLINIAILMEAIGEYKYVGEMDRAVVINNAVKLAKKYSDAKDYKFINALLDNVL